MKIPFFFEPSCALNCPKFGTFGLNFAPEGTTGIREAYFWANLGSKLHHRCAHLGLEEPLVLTLSLSWPEGSF